MCNTCSDFNNTAVPVGMVRGTAFPPFPTPATLGFDQLDDNVLTPTGGNFGAQAASANYNWIQVQLDGVYSDISHMRIWAGDPARTSSSGFLSVWLSRTTNFTATGTRCVRGVAIMAGLDGVITCPAVSNALYGEPFFHAIALAKAHAFHRTGWR